MTRPAWDGSAQFAASARTSLRRVPRARARSLARWITGPSAERIAEGHAQLDHIGAGVDRGQGNLARQAEIGALRRSSGELAG
jgi:hypothetical protein